jgi:hypothetical protein
MKLTHADRARFEIHPGCGDPPGHPPRTYEACEKEPGFGFKINVLLSNSINALLKEYIHRRSIGGRYAREARQKFMDAQQALGYQADLAYNIALCYYRMKQFGPALKHLAEIIERGVREHPELSVGSQTDGMEVKSVGNTPVLKETALIEAFNLKAAIEYVMKNPDATREALTDMPPRSEEELDPVTLHNIALMNMAGARLYSCVACHIQSLTHSLMKGALVSIHDPPYR